MQNDSMMTKTAFFEQFGHRLVKVNVDDPETGDFQLFCPEEKTRAAEYQKNGYEVASVYEPEDEDGEDIVIFDNDPSPAHMKIGFLVLRTHI